MTAKETKSKKDRKSIEIPLTQKLSLRAGARITFAVKYRCIEIKEIKKCLCHTFIVLQVLQKLST